MIQLSYRQIFWLFLILGCSAFGGPAAHLVLFYRRLVQDLNYISEQQYSEILALAQILPGPTSSQVGIGLGYSLKGYRGALCAWLGFTLPAMLLMTLAAILGVQLTPYLTGPFFHVIQLLVLSVVIWAFWQMLRSFCQTTWQYIIMLLATMLIYVLPHGFNQIVLIGMGAIAGMYYANPKTQPAQQQTLICVQQRIKARVCLILFSLPFLLVPILHWVYPSLWLESFMALYRTASLVFGGGHVILPLLQQEFVETGILAQPQFDLGYALAQLMPGPLFSFASYLGALLPLSSSAVVNAIFATVVIFLPSFLLMFGLLPFWSKLMQKPRLFAALVGINAAVVGLLLYLVLEMGQKYLSSVWDVIFVVVVIALLRTKVPIWLSLISSFVLYYALLVLL
ncbi:chromate efflux transporter [uncultured Acinetobacter sp.]|uniref:chromate efflux transporter n=1 Tax=uncultured Acinetobacter sp. TaxID=165433 RepID=UPI002616A5AA|nr:chromate efflux transporter [uncultured Acinetobacter sp.]